MIKIYDNEEIAQLVREFVRTEMVILANTIKAGIEDGTIKVPQNGIEVGIDDDTPVQDLEWTARVAHVLYNARLETVGELCALSENGLLKYRNMGKKSVLEIVERLGRHGRRLAPNYQA